MMRETLVVLLVMAGSVLALTPGRYNDYTWDTDYRQPQRPAGALDPSNCQALLNGSYCGEISGSNLTGLEKRTVMAEAAANCDGTSKRSFVRSWNDNVSFGRYPPDGIQVYNGPTIRNAWVAIADIDSVMDEQNRTWVPDGAEVRIEKNLEMVVSRVQSQGGCPVNYVIKGYDYSLETFVDGQLISSSSGESNRIAIHPQKKHGERSNITAKLTFIADYEIEVQTYQAEDICDDGCLVWSCKRAYTILSKDEGSVSDSKAVYVYDDSSIIVRNLIEESQDGVVKGVIAGAITDGINIELIIGESELDIRTASYSVSPAAPPYDLMTVTVAPEKAAESMHMEPHGDITQDSIPQTGHPLPEELQIRNMTGKSFLLYRYAAFTPSLSCEMRFSGYFSNGSKPFDCGYDPKRESGFSMSLRNVSEKETEATLRLRDENGLPIPNRTVDIRYADGGRSIMTDEHGEAVLLLNRTEKNEVLGASFETDLAHPGTEAMFIVEPYGRSIGWVLDYIYVGAVMWIVFYMYKRLGRMVVI